MVGLRQSRVCFIFSAIMVTSALSWCAENSGGNEDDQAQREEHRDIALMVAAKCIAGVEKTEQAIPKWEERLAEDRESFKTHDQIVKFIEKIKKAKEQVKSWKSGEMTFTAQDLRVAPPYQLHDFGVMPYSVEVTQLIRPGVFHATYETGSISSGTWELHRIQVEGYSTQGLVSGDDVSLSGYVYFYKIRTYPTVTGGTNTILVARATDIETKELRKFVGKIVAQYYAKQRKAENETLSENRSSRRKTTRQRGT